MQGQDATKLCLFEIFIVKKLTYLTKQSTKSIFAETCLVPISRRTTVLAYNSITFISSVATITNTYIIVYITIKANITSIIFVTMAGGGGGAGGGGAGGGRGGGGGGRGGV